MDPNDRRNVPQSTNSGEATQQSENITPEDTLRDAPPGSSILNASPGVQGPADNPVQQRSRDAGDILADEVREGQWATPAEERDNARGGDRPA